MQTINKSTDPETQVSSEVRYRLESLQQKYRLSLNYYSSEYNKKPDFNGRLTRLADLLETLDEATRPKIAALRDEAGTLAIHWKKVPAASEIKKLIRKGNSLGTYFGWGSHFLVANMEM